MARLSDVVPVSASVAEAIATLEEVAESERPPLSEVLERSPAPVRSSPGSRPVPGGPDELASISC